MTPYHERVLKQTENWVGSLCQHNNIDDECCPDFSCCKPELFEEDRSKRIEYLNKLRNKHGLKPFSD